MNDVTALDYLARRASSTTVPIVLLKSRAFSKWLQKQSAVTKNWVRGVRFRPRVGAHCLIPARDGSLSRVVAIEGERYLTWASLASALPERSYRIDGTMTPDAANDAALGWALGTYEFTAYRARKGKPATLVWPEQADQAHVGRLARGIFLARDLINTPAGDLGPVELADAARAVAKAHRAKCSVIVGDNLLKENYPTVHAVGRAGAQPPRLIDIRWGAEEHPKLTLVGKGVCFDSGGLNLKPASGMKLMKKDMGGAATVLGLAQAVMDAKLPVRLRVLIPAVENSVAGNAMRPLDVVRTRSGKTVEIGNTDAEGRLILCDALAEAVDEDPDLIVDFATLTGAARVALGTDVPVVFGSHRPIAEELVATGEQVGDPLWQLPLHRGYRKLLDSKVADLNNISSSRYGGAITAALFLAEFVGPSRPWVHIDTMAYNLASRPGHPVGGEAMGLRAVYAFLRSKFSEPS